MPENTPKYRNPLPTVDVIIEIDGRVVLVKRRNPPEGWALPGGFVEYGESIEVAARRETLEETGLELDGLQQFAVFSDPSRDPRHHTITTVFSARGRGALKAGDDAAEAALFDPARLPELIAFDHRAILERYFGNRSGAPAGASGIDQRRESVQAQLLKKATPYATYCDIAVGSRSFFKFLKYEFLNNFFSAMKGAKGLFFRKHFFARQFRKVGRNVVFGRNIVVRHPAKIEIGDNVFIDDNVVLDAKGSGNRGIRIGSNCFIGRGTILSCKEGDILLDDYVSVSQNCSLLSETVISIGRYCLLAGNCDLVAGGNHNIESVDVPICFQNSLSKGGIELAGDNWLGAGAIVLDGVRLGYGAVASAGAVVYKSVEDYAIAVGNPALVSKRRKKLDR
jgi:ADP-ribose pyrophosphatase YjhB (NUDIX family)/acetyltransferase-like isoleucine patch superfamily enzyme